MTPVLHHGDMREVLAALAARFHAVVTDLAVGTAAEHLVCADLLLAGYRAFLADQNCPYDVAVDVAGRLVRIQVKATRCQRAIPQKATHIPAYMWHVRRAGKAGTRAYSSADFDLLALVAIDIKAIAYLPPSHTKQTIHIRPPGAAGGKQFQHYPFLSALGEICHGR
jgi:PD-(D/E)XK endonuclease